MSIYHFVTGVFLLMEMLIEYYFVSMILVSCILSLAAWVYDTVLSFMPQLTGEAASWSILS